MKILVSPNSLLTDYDVDLTEIHCEPVDFFLSIYDKISSCSIKDNYREFIYYCNMSKNWLKNMPLCVVSSRKVVVVEMDYKSIIARK